MKADHVDLIRQEWARAMPHLDSSSLEISGRILRLAAYLQRTAARTLNEDALSVGDFSVLVTLRRRDRPEGLTPTEISAATMVTSGATTGRIDRLEKAMLVVRKPDPEDRRAVRVRLTPRGLLVAERAIERVIACDQILLRPLTKPQRDRLSEALRLVTLALEADPPES